MAAEQPAATFQWLIERGQPEGEPQAVWLEHSGQHPARDRCWTTNANKAAMFPSQETAEGYIYVEELDARAVEHGFIAGQKAGQRGPQILRLHDIDECRRNVLTYGMGDIDV